MKTLSSARPRPSMLIEMPRLFRGAKKSAEVNCEPLIGVPDFGLAEGERGVQRGQAEAGLHGVGKFPTEHEAAEPIHYRNQIQKATMHRKVGNIGAPDLVGSFDRNAAQQVRVDLVAGSWATQVRLGIVSFDS